jgi:hypothetical protein
VTTGTALLALCTPLLTGTTNAGARVYTPADIPSVDGEYPMLLVDMDEESGESLGNIGGPQFVVTHTLAVRGRVDAPADTGDLGAASVYAALNTLRDQILAAILGGAGLAALLAPNGPVQEFTGYRSEKSRSDATAGRHYGQVVVTFEIAVRADLRDFGAPSTVPLENVHVTTGVASGTTPVQVDTYNLNA